MTQEFVPSFDEKAALAELERLRDSIQAARQARQRTSAEFDAFVRSFRTPAATPTSQHPLATPPKPDPQRPTPAQPTIPRIEPRDPLPTVSEVSSDRDRGVAVAAAVSSGSDAVVAPAALEQVPGRRYRLKVRPIGIAGATAIVALGIVSAWWATRASPPARVKPSINNTEATRNPPTPVPAPIPSAPVQQAAHGVALELKPLRPVWMRVVIDGRKELEGTVPPEKALNFTGDSIVVRAGNAGDVLVKTGGREETFGVAGQPLTRTFSKH